MNIEPVPVAARPVPRVYRIVYTWRGERFHHPVDQLLSMPEAKDDLRLMRSDGWTNAYIERGV